MGITYLLTCVLRFNFELKATCHLAKALICASLDLLQSMNKME